MNKAVKWLAVLMITGLLAAACSAAPVEETASSPADQPVQESGESMANEPAVVGQSGETEPAKDSEAEEAVAVGSDEEETVDIPVTGVDVEHLVSPETFTYSSLQRVVDCNTGPRAANNTEPLVAPDCDRWDVNRYERPMDDTGWGYLPQVDIVEVELGQDSEWIYAQIELFMIGDDAPVLDGSYALEIDLNLDARGDLLLMVDNPAAVEPGQWSVSGVRVWDDANDDVGGQTAVAPDGENAGDGYEVNLFDSGLGEDPDLAWARVNPDQPNIVELSFKKSLLRGKTVFAWWAWAGAAPFDPSSFDYSDTFSEDGFTSLDNTCAWMFGQAPTSLANICPTIFIPQVESPGRRGGGSGSAGEPDTCTPPPGGCPYNHMWWEPACACVWIN